MDIHELMKRKHYDHEQDVTLADLKELGQVITDDMCVGELLGIVEVLYYGEEIEEEF